MTRDQMIAWLCLEGWVPRAYKKGTESIGIVRGRQVIGTHKGYHNVHYEPQAVFMLGIPPIYEWEQISLVQLEEMYEKARLL